VYTVHAYYEDQYGRTKKQNTQREKMKNGKDETFTKALEAHF